MEEAVLGALMIEKDAYSLVSEILRPESFYEHRHQLIYAAITDLETMQELSERKPKSMMDILPFISQTEEIIITPWLKLMENVAYLESSGI